MIWLIFFLIFWGWMIKEIIDNKKSIKKYDTISVRIYEKYGVELSEKELEEKIFDGLI